MGPLFNTSLKYTFDEYKRFSKAVMKKNMKKVYTSLIILLVCAGLLSIVSPDSYLSIFLLIFIVIYPVMLRLGQNRAIKKTYNSNELFKDITQDLEFYENYFIAKTEKSEAKVEYKELYEVIENKTNFYLMIANNQGYLISKKNCNNELIEFISNLKK